MNGTISRRARLGFALVLYPMVARAATWEKQNIKDAMQLWELGQKVLHTRSETFDQGEEVKLPSGSSNATFTVKKSRSEKGWEQWKGWDAFYFTAREHDPASHVDRATTHVFWKNGIYLETTQQTAQSIDRNGLKSSVVSHEDQKGLRVLESRDQEGEFAIETVTLIIFKKRSPDGNLGAPVVQSRILEIKDPSLENGRATLDLPRDMGAHPLDWHLEQARTRLKHQMKGQSVKK